MASRELSKHLQLNVTNVGPIARADIELRPMTVFVGPSNTGKSYLAILIYALHRFFSGRALRPAFRRYFRAPSVFGFGPGSSRRESVPRRDVESLTSWLEESLLGDEGDSSQMPVELTLPKSVAKQVLPWLEGVSNYEQALYEEISRCFGVEDPAGLVRNRIAEGSCVAVKRPVADTTGVPTSLGYCFAISRKHREFSPCLPEHALLRMQTGSEWSMKAVDELHNLRDELRYERIDDTRFNVRSVLSTLSEAIGRGIVSPLDREAHYLPADRTGVMHAHRVVVGSLIGQAARAGFERDTPLPRLSGVLADFLEQLVGLEDPRPNTGKMSNESLAEEIERDILQGEIRTTRSPVGYPEFLYRPEGWKEDLGLINTSSMVSELAPVVLYLRYVVRPGETLIIEEPESHLHPALQVEFTRRLAAAVRAGVRVIITTHSEWVLEELANLVRLSDLPEAQRKGIGGGDYGLTRDQLGVWRFEPKLRPKGSVVKEAPFDPDVGNFDSGFDKVAMDTYNDQAEIIRREERAKASARRR